MVAPSYEESPFYMGVYKNKNHYLKTLGEIVISSQLWWAFL